MVTDLNREVLEIAQLGAPVLRRQAARIATPESGPLSRFFQDLESTMSHFNGVGIAAPQVYKSIRAFIVASKPNARYPNAPEMLPTLMLNPEITAFSEETEKDWEGCLSIPGIRAQVERSKAIDVRYQNLDGSVITTHFSGFIARIFQHELDHLDGIVFLDRADSHDCVTEKEYLRLLSDNGPNRS